MGSISGVRPTATASAKKKAPTQSPLVRPLISSTTGTMMAANLMSSQLTLLRPVWKALGPVSAAVACAATAPKKLRAPVWTTSAVAVPETTLVPMKTRLAWARGSGSCSGPANCANFSTGSDSPVKAAWEMNRSRAVSRRQSAGIMSPADSSSTSPSTSFLIGTSRRPCRITVAVLLTSAFSDSAARLDRCSCTKRSAVLSATMVLITTVALRSCVAQDTAARAVSSRLNGSRKQCPRCRHQGRGPSCSTRFGPCRASRAAASRVVRPSGRECRRCSAAPGSSRATSSRSCVMASGGAPGRAFAWPRPAKASCSGWRAKCPSRRRRCRKRLKAARRWDGRLVPAPARTPSGVARA